MYLRCEKRGFWVEGVWVPKGGVKRITKATAEMVKNQSTAGLISLHSKDPAARRVSARKSKAAPGMESLEKAVNKDTEK
jgi:hypothetical protein